jgi:pyruvate-formate lyase-activating enzyme
MCHASRIGWQIFGICVLEVCGMEEFILESKPNDMLVEITNRCNYQCNFCLHSQMNHHFGDIDPKLLKKVLHEAYDMGVRKVGLYTIGEMFLCKDIVTHIKNAKETGYEYIYSDTNGALANRTNLEAVISAGLDSIKFSINAGKSETYKKIHGHDTFETVLENLKVCYELKQKLNRQLKIMVSFVVTKENEEEIELLRGKVEPYINEYMVHRISVRHDCVNDTRNALEPKMGKSIQKIPCFMVFTRLHITFDGYLTACCQDFNYDLLLADLKKTPLKDAWAGKNAVELRQAHMQGNVEGLLCDNCIKAEYQKYEPLKL